MLGPSKPLSVPNTALDLLKVQNISLTNKITALKRQTSDLSGSQNEYDQKNITLETNFSLFKLHWNKHLEEIKSLRLLSQPLNDQREFEECLSMSQKVMESMRFQQSQEEFKENLIKIFAVMSQAQRDLITNLQKNTIEKQEDTALFQEKLEEFSKSIEVIRQINRKIEENPYHIEVQGLKKKTEKLEKELLEVRECNEALTRRLKISLKGFIEIDENLEKDMELGCICGGKMFDYLAVKSIKDNKESVTGEKDASSVEQKLADLEKDFAGINIQEEDKTIKKVEEQKN